MRDIIVSLCAALGLVFALFDAARAQTTYQGSVQPNGTGGYFFNGPNGRLQGGATPNLTWPISENDTRECIDVLLEHHQHVREFRLEGMRWAHPELKEHFHL